MAPFVHAELRGAHLNVSANAAAEAEASAAVVTLGLPPFAVQTVERRTSRDDTDDESATGSR